MADVVETDIAIVEFAIRAAGGYPAPVVAVILALGVKTRESSETGVKLGGVCDVRPGRAAYSANAPEMGPDAVEAFLDGVGADPGAGSLLGPVEGNSLAVGHLNARRAAASAKPAGHRAGIKGDRV